MVGVWSVIGSLVPQGLATNTDVMAWARTHPGLEPYVRAVNLHQAFANPLFLTLAFLLAVSTALCAWERTKVARRRSATLRDAARAGLQSVVETHDMEIACDPALSGAEALSTASDVLKVLGIKVKSQDGALVSVSPRWTSWGSPIFHWALFGLFVALVVGNAYRAEGLMGVAVGETKPDAQASYGILHSGLLRNWNAVHRSIRVDAFEPNFKLGGVDRGPTPTVTVLGGDGKVLKTQRVYPNNTLKTGALTIYPSSFGLAVHASVVNSNGEPLGQGSQLVDFSQEASGGTIAVGGIYIPDASGAPVYDAKVTVPLARGEGGWVQFMPAQPSARVVVTTRDGKTVLDQVVHKGDILSPPGSLSFRLDDIVYYARLQVVEDWTIPLLYAVLAVALVGLSIATLARQQIVLATVVDTSDGVRFVARVRLWRNAPTSRGELESELSRALGGDEKGSTT